MSVPYDIMSVMYEILTIYQLWHRDCNSI